MLTPSVETPALIHLQTVIPQPWRGTTSDLAHLVRLGRALQASSAPLASGDPETPAVMLPLHLTLELKDGKVLTSTQRTPERVLEGLAAPEDVVRMSLELGSAPILLDSGEPRASFAVTFNKFGAAVSVRGPNDPWNEDAFAQLKTALTLAKPKRGLVLNRKLAPLLHLVPPVLLIAVALTALNPPSAQTSLFIGVVLAVGVFSVTNHVVPLLVSRFSVRAVKERRSR